MTFSEFLSEFSGSPKFAPAVILITAVIAVNGWTDAPTAIATCVSTRSLKPAKAVLLAAVMNFTGVFIMSRINSQVASTIFNMVNFGEAYEKASVAICAALASIVIWSVAAWIFGIPTSESHALIASLSGSAIAINHSLDGINKAEWIKVLYGLVLSTFLGFILGFFAIKLVNRIIRNTDREKLSGVFSCLQNLSASFMSFMHGAQDGQKFIGVFMLIISLNSSGGSPDSENLPMWILLYCSAVMAVGTSLGGMKIIKAMGIDMVRLKKHQGFSADLAGAVSLLIATLTGLPVSTTHAKTTAIMGVGAAGKLSSLDWKIVKEMLLTWLLTFPGCGFLGYLVTVFFMR